MRCVRAAVALLLGIHAPLLLGLVPAPQEVRVHCSDDKPRVTWKYEDVTAARFTVHLGGSGGLFEKETSCCEFDLRDFVWSSAEQMLDYMTVEVTATQGPNRSEMIRSKSFTYNPVRTVDIHCHLPFPPVNFTSEGPEVKLSFSNPLHFYPNLLKTGAADFVYSITTKNREEQKRVCVPQDKLCSFSWVSPEDPGLCVNLTGVIMKTLEKIPLLPTEVCATAPSVWLMVTLILCVSVLVVAIVAAAIAICKTRAWSLSEPQTPKALIPAPPRRAQFVSPPETFYSPVHVSGSRPELNLEDPQSPGPDPELGQTEDRVLIQPEDQWYPEGDLEESGESISTETESINSSESDEILGSNYEKRTFQVPMDLSGDLVTAYTS